ncbi:lamin tail domain-containing protein [Mesonia sp.]|uniref:lamin tail domain-containing protein n=1 Tax=Mesonia sp. TaxID=1960830 RepID=UPI00257C0E4F|nr:lamin tail domain-containing protein [Mesonia sp.]
MPGLVEWYAIAFSNGETDRYPVSGFGSYAAVNMFNPSLFVNEIMAINDSTISDESGEFDDWFEIYNAEEYPVPLEGFYVTDKKDNLTKWQFPASDIEILPSEHIIVWCDEDEEQGIAHTNFKLSGSGEFLAIVAPDGVTIVDSISFQQQQPDISYGRTADGGEEWNFFDSPTPGATNQLLSIDQYNYIPFGTTDFQHGITAGSNNFQIQNQPGIYRVSFKLTIQKTGGNSQNIKFFLAKGYSSTNLVAGSEVYANVSNGEIITISGEKLVQLNAYESIGIFSDTSSSSVQVLASGSSFNIEMISQ